MHVYIFVKPAILCKPWLKAPWLKLALLASDAIRSGGGVRISFPCLVGYKPKAEQAHTAFQHIVDSREGSTDVMPSTIAITCEDKDPSV